MINSLLNNPFSQKILNAIRNHANDPIAHRSAAQKNINGVIAALYAINDTTVVPPSGVASQAPILAGEGKLLFGQMLLPSWPMQSANKSAWSAAVTAGSAKIAVLGHSIIQGNNQNTYGTTVYNAIKRVLREAFPNVAMQFCNYAIGGTTASQATPTGVMSNIVSAPAATFFRQFWETDSINTSTPGAWLAKVRTYSPDLLFIQFDLNETSHVTYGDAMEAILTNIATWAKVPTIILGTSHVGLTNGPVTPEIVRRTQQVTRMLARKYRTFLSDAGRIYDVLTGLGDPCYIVPLVRDWECAFRGQIVSGQNVPTALIDNIQGTAFSPSGITVRDAASAAVWRFNRKVNCNDGAVQASFTLGNTSGRASLFYRVDPTDANYGAGTGSQYEIRVSDNGTNTVMQAFYWTGGAAVAISGATFNFTTRIGTNTKFQIRAEFRGCNHVVQVFNPTSGTYQEFIFSDYRVLNNGFLGVGVSGSGGGFIDVGASAGNALSNGFVCEDWERANAGFCVYTDQELHGSNTSSIWNASFGDYAGGNSINHLTNFGQKVIYEYPMIEVAKSLQA